MSVTAASRVGIHVTVLYCYMIASLASAGLASADGPDGSRDAASLDPPPGETVGLPTDQPQASAPCRSVALESGYDKCKRREPWPLPLWCSGASSWPVLKARSVTAEVTGIHIARPPGSRERHK
jgi:hypothetical protein